MQKNNKQLTIALVVTVLFVLLAGGMEIFHRWQAVSAVTVSPAVLTPLSLDIDEAVVPDLKARQYNGLGAELPY